MLNKEEINSKCLKSYNSRGEEMEEYQLRVIKEKKRLDEDAKKLSEFIGNNPLFDEVDAEEQERMKIQNDLMWQLSEVLGQRIAAF